MDDINLVIMSGVIVGTPEVKEIGAKKTQVCTARIKSTRSFTYNGQTKESSCTRSLKSFGNAGKKLSQLRGGDKVMIQGRQATESWADKNDATKKVFKDIVEVSEVSADIKFEQQEYAPKNQEQAHTNAPTQDHMEEDTPF